MKGGGEWDVYGDRGGYGGPPPGGGYNAGKGHVYEDGKGGCKGDPGVEFGHGVGGKSGPPVNLWHGPAGKIHFADAISCNPDYMTLIVTLIIRNPCYGTLWRNQLCHN